VASVDERTGSSGSQHVYCNQRLQVARLQFKRRQSGQVKRRKHISRGAQGVEMGIGAGGDVPLPAEGGG